MPSPIHGGALPPAQSSMDEFESWRARPFEPFSQRLSFGARAGARRLLLRGTPERFVVAVGGSADSPAKDVSAHEPHSAVVVPWCRFVA